MIWFVSQQIFVLIYYWYKADKSSPKPSSISSMSYFGRKISEWILLLFHRPLFSHGNWLMRCPKYLFDCCPLVKVANEDIMDRLTGLNPVKELSYLVLRRLAELIAQLVASWLISVWTITLIICVWFVLKQKICQKTKNKKRNSSSIWNSKYIWLLLILVPLSFIAVYLHISVLGTSHPQCAMGDQKSFFRSMYDLMSWKNKRRSHDVPSVLNILSFPSLYQDLYCEDESSKICKTATEKFCMAAKISLSWWSILVADLLFIIFICGIIVSVLYVCGLAGSFTTSCFSLDITAFCKAFVWIPQKTIFSRFCSKHSNSVLLQSGKEDRGSTKKREESTDLKLESGDTQDVQKRIRTYSPPKDIIQPRYVSRGVRACLDDEDFF